MVDEQLAGIEKLAGAKLDVRDSAEGVEGVKRGFPEFDLILRVSAAQADAQRARIQKESSSSKRSSPAPNASSAMRSSSAARPPMWSTRFEEKLAGYQAQLQKLRESLI